MTDWTIWTIYDHPSDYPDSYIARKWVVKGGEPLPTEETIIKSSLEELRAEVSVGRDCFSRMEQDDPCIVESWW